MRNFQLDIRSGRFIAEGGKLVERLMRSGYQVHSLLISDKYLDQWQARVPAETLAIVVPESRVPELLGLQLHRGIIACGLRRPPLDLREKLSVPLAREATMVALQGVQDPENMGGILRSCAALGIDMFWWDPGVPIHFRAASCAFRWVTVLKL